MSQPSCIRVSYTIQKTTRCYCSAYKFPHKWGVGLCNTSIISNPPSYAPPRKGLASKLEHILQVYADSEDELIQELIEALRLT